MRILYLIFVLCVVALLFTALAAARHIRRHEEKRKSTADEKPETSSDVAPKTEVLVPMGKSRGN